LHNLPEKVALPFKINLMRTVHQMHSNPARVEPYLNELLNTNYQLIIAEYEDENENENTNSISFCEPEDCFSGSNEDSN